MHSLVFPCQICQCLLIVAPGTFTAGKTEKVICGCVDKCNEKWKRHYRRIVILSTISFHNKDNVFTTYMLLMIVLSILIAHLIMHSIFLSYWWFKDSKILLKFLHTIMSVLNRVHKSNIWTNLERLIQFWIGSKKISPHELSL